MAFCLVSLFNISATPGDLRTTNLGPNVVTFILPAARNVPPGTRFVLQFREPGANWREAGGAPASPRSRPIPLTGLRPDTPYQFRIRYVNGPNRSPWGRVVDITTPSEYNSRQPFWVFFLIAELQTRFESSYFDNGSMRRYPQTASWLTIFGSVG